MTKTFRYYHDKLRELFPTAIIIFEGLEKHIRWDFKFNIPISEKQHDDSFESIKEIFGNSLLERYTEETGKKFYIYQKYDENTSILNLQIIER